MADETETKKKKAWGRYEHESGVWIQFKKGPYRYREQREWNSRRNETQIFAFLIERLEAWHFVDGDGNELDLEALRALGSAAMQVPDVLTATKEDLAAAIKRVDEFGAAFDNVEVPMLRWLVTSGDTFMTTEIMSAPKA